MDHSESSDQSSGGELIIGLVDIEPVAPVLPSHGDSEVDSDVYAHG